MTQFFRDAGRALLANGYLIIPIKPGEKRPALSAWQNARLGAADLGAYPDHGVGILCGQGASPVVGIDIDISHPVIGPAIVTWCREHLGWAPERVGAAPRVLLTYRAESGGWAKGNSLSFFDPNDPVKPSGKRNDQQIEVLGLGQQFVAYHLHPDTGRPYEWTDLFGGLEYVKAADLPVITEQQVENLMLELDRLVRATPGLETVRSQAGTALAVSDDEWLLSQQGKADITLDEARVLLAQLDNRVGTDYDTWVTVGMALHHQFDGSAAALALWDEWGSQSPKNVPGEAARKWRSFGKGSRQISIRWLIKVSNTARDDRLSRELRDTMDSILASIEQAADQYELTEKVAKEIRLKLPEAPGPRAEVFGNFQARFKVLTGTNLPVADVRRMLIAHAPLSRIKMPLTEFGNTERMLTQYGKGLRYVPEVATWLTWTGVYWKSAPDIHVEHLAKLTIRALGSESELHADDAANFYNFCAISQQAKMVRSMVALAASDPRVALPAEELNKDTHLLGVLNGMVDLRTGELLPPDPNKYITRVCECEYRPGGPADLFLQTVSEAFFGDADLVEFFLRSLGYTIQGRPSDDLMFIPFGNGANGKSTILGAVRRTLGGYSKSADAGTFVTDGKGGGNAGGAREDLVRLMGARLVLVNEPDENGELREGSVKSMTGGDAIAARGLYSKTSVEILPSWVVWMPTNHKPIVKGSDNGIWRRLAMVPFERNFENDPNVKKDPKREEKLLAEMPGILYQIVMAGIRYQRDGLNPPAAVQAAHKAYRNQMDLLAEWLEEQCDVGDEFSEESSRLWSSWEQFAKNRGIISYVKSSVALGRRLDSRFPARKGARGVRIRQGIRLKTDFSVAGVAGQDLFSINPITYV